MNPFILKNIIPKTTAGGLAPYLGVETISWWDPTDPASVTKSGGRFDRVNDKAGSNDLIGVGASRPFDSRIINGLEVLDFQGNQNMQVNFATQSQPNTYIVVYANDITAVNRYVFDGIGGRNLLSSNGLTPEIMYSGATINGSIYDVTISIMTLIFNGSNSKMYKNGVLSVQGNTGALGMGGISIGSRYNLTLALDGFIGDLFMYNPIITDSQLNQTGQYLADKYAISYTDIV